jgi:nucleoside-diphosphate-sugar epimerase
LNPLTRETPPEEESDMNLLVLGGTGFLSGTVVREALATGHRVSIVTRGRRPAPPGVEALVADRSDRAALAGALGGRAFDAVIDCIGFKVEDAAQDLELFAGRAGHLVFISTDFVYGGEPRRLPLPEDAPTEALNGYGRNKRACEELLLREGPGRGLSVTALRPPHILGAGSHLGTGSLQGRDPMLLGRLRHGAPLVLLDGGALLIQPVSATDVARAALASIAAPAGNANKPAGRTQPSNNPRGAVYNIAGPDGVTTERYYETIADLLGVSVRILSLPARLWVAARPDRDPFAQHRLYSTAALTRDTGFRPEISLEAMLRETIAWLQQSGAAQPYVASPVEDAMIAQLLAGEAELAALLGAA